MNQTDIAILSGILTIVVTIIFYNLLSSIKSSIKNSNQILMKIYEQNGGKLTDEQKKWINK